MTGVSTVLRQQQGSGTVPPITYRQAGDQCLLVEYGTGVFALWLNFYVQAVVAAVDGACPRGIREVAPGLNSLTVVTDGVSGLDAIIDELDALHKGVAGVENLRLTSRIVKLPIAVDDSVTRGAVRRYCATVRDDAVNCATGSNVDYVLQYNGLSDKEALKAHLAATEMWVTIIGTYPGLPFLCPLRAQHSLIAPKYNPPRTWTPSGSVGLGGPSLSIYPVDSPGGYQLIGRTIPVFDAARRHRAFRDDPILLRAGDRVHFVPVEEDELDATIAQVLADEYDYGVTTEEFSVDEYLREQQSAEAEATAFAARRDAAAAQTPAP